MNRLGPTRPVAGRDPVPNTWYGSTHPTETECGGSTAIHIAPLPDNYLPSKCGSYYCVAECKDDLNALHCSEIMSHSPYFRVTRYSD